VPPMIVAATVTNPTTGPLLAQVVENNPADPDSLSSLRMDPRSSRGHAMYHLGYTSFTNLHRSLLNNLGTSLPNHSEEDPRPSLPWSSESDRWEACWSLVYGVPMPTAGVEDCESYEDDESDGDDTSAPALIPRPFHDSSEEENDDDSLPGLLPRPFLIDSSDEENDDDHVGNGVKCFEVENAMCEAMRGVQMVNVD